MKNVDKRLAFMLHHAEFRCRCYRTNCTFTLVSPELLVAWEKLRRHLKRPIHITSGFRCQEHNSDRKVGGLANSRHTKGLAMDIMPGKNLEFDLLLTWAARFFDFTLAYREEGFIHCHIFEK